MPLLEAVAESVGNAIVELLYFGSVRPYGACAIAGATVAIAFCVRSGAPGSWMAGIALTAVMSAIGFGLGWWVNRAFSDNRPMRVATCIAAAGVTLGSLGWLIFGG